jgi:hypothetical protein
MFRQVDKSVSAEDILVVENNQLRVRSNAALACWTVVLLTIAIGPIFVFKYPGLQDYPNHLARGFILLNRADPQLSRLYDIRWSPLPNLGWDLWAIVVGRILDLEWTGKVFLALSGTSIVLGCFALNRALLSRWTFAPLLAVPFMFSSAFRLGFLNFELSVGCSLLAAAWWISADQAHWIRRLVLATLFSTALYFIHFYGWAFYGLFLLSYELRSVLKSGNRLADIWAGLLRLLRDGTQCIPVLAVMVYTAVTQPQPELTFTAFKPPYLRLSELIRLIDVGHPIWNVAILILLGLFIFEMFRRRWIRFCKALIWPIGISVFGFFLMPDQIADTFYVSWRLLLMAVLVSIASCYPSREGDARLSSIMSIVALITIGIVGLQWQSWRNSESGTESFIKLTQNVPAGSKLFVVHNGMTTQQLANDAIGLYHVGAYAVITRRALVQSMFVMNGQQVLRFRAPAMQSTPRGSATMLSDIKREFWRHEINLPEHLRQFDFVIVHGPDSGDDLEVLQTQAMAPVDRLQDFRLYKVLKTD